MPRQSLAVTGLTPEEMKTYLHSDFAYKRGLKLFAVFLISKGWSARKLEEIFEVSFKQITTWVHEVNERGIEGIEEKSKSGRTPKLTAEERESLKTVIMKTSPKAHGFDELIWKGEVVGMLIQQKFGVSYKKAQIYNIINALNIEFINGAWVEKQS